MLISAHVLIGALIGRVCPSPGAAFAAGVASHFVADATPHWGALPAGTSFRSAAFLKVAVPDGLVGMVLLAAITRASPADHRKTALAAMLGACLPDADKPTGLLFGRSPWPAAVNRFHSRIQDEAPNRLPRDAAIITGLLGLWMLTSRPTP